MPDSKPLPRLLMLAVAVAQGLLLFGLYKTLDLDVWPSQNPLWFLPLWTLSLVLPLFYLLSIDSSNTKRVLLLLGGFAIVLTLLALYIGWQAEPFGEFPIYSLLSIFAFSMTVACFKALMYLQQQAAQLPMSYQVLFTYSWRNFLTLALSTLFILVFWAILWLWAGLFDVIGIEFFSNLFAQDWFIFPVLGFANGVGIIIFRELTQVIDSITHLLQGLIRLLLPFVVAIAAIFLLTLPFTGLDVLWATGRGTSLLLWLTAIILFFANAVYQDGRGDAPYPAGVHRLIYIGLFVLPFLSVLSFYGLWLRLDQYGWTVERTWAFVTWAILALFCAGYIGGIVQRKALWPSALGQVNTVMGLAVMAIMLAANSPLLDFRKLSLDSQLARLDAGTVTLHDFDFYYVRGNLARPGYFAIERIKAELGDSDPELLAEIENPEPRYSAVSVQDVEQFWQNATYRPANIAVPPELRLIIERANSNRNRNRNADAAMILKIDMNGDGQDEYVVLTTTGTYISGSQYYWVEEGQWQQGTLGFSANNPSDDIFNILKDEQIELVDPPFKSLKIGDIVLRPN